MVRRNRRAAVRASALGLGLGLGVVILASGVGCGPPRTPYPAALNSDRPGERMRAIKRAAEIDDQAVLGLIVDRLEDEDEGVRFYAILALERMTGSRRGYDYRASEPRRWRAVQAWRRYLVDRQAGDGGGGGGGTGGSEP